MGEEVISSLSLDTRQYTEPLAALKKEHLASAKAALAYGQAIGSIDKDAKVASTVLKDLVAGVGNLTTKVNFAKDKFGNFFPQSFSQNIRSTTKEIQAATDTTKNLGIALSRLALSTSKKIQVTNTDALKSLLSPERLKTGSASEIINFRNLEAQFQASFAKLVLTSKLTQKEITEIFNNIKIKNFGDIPLVAKDAVSDFLKMKGALRDIGTEAGKSIAQVTQLARAARATNILERRIDPRFQDRKQQATQFIEALPNVSDQTPLITKLDVETKKLNASTRDSIKFFRESNLTLQQFDVAKRAAFAREPVQRFIGDQGILFEKLIKVKDALRNVGAGTRDFNAKLAGNLDKAARGKDFADQFRGLTGPGPTLLGEIPSGVNVGLETQIQKGIQAIGRESAAIKEVEFDFQHMQEIAAKAASGIITDIGGLSPALQRVEVAIQGVIQKLIKLNAEAAKQKELAAFAASAPARFAAVSSRLATTFNTTAIPSVSPKEQANVDSSITETINAYGRLNNIDLSRFDAILAEAMGSATTLLQGNERVLFDFIRKNVEAFSQAGASSQKYIDGLTRLSAANSRIKNLTDINLGTPFINAAVDIKKATSLALNYGDQLQRIAAKTIAVGEKRGLPVSTAEETQIIDAAKIGTSAIKLLDVELRGLARAYQRLIQLQGEFGVAGQTATERVRKETEKLTRETNKKAAQAAAQAKLPGVFGDVQRITEKSLGPISDFARAGDRQRVESQISNISTAIAQGKIAVSDYTNALDLIKSKKITPPSANQDINQLRDNVYGLVTSMQTATDRGNNFHKSIISLTNGLRLLVVSELYVFFSQLRTIISQTTATTIDLSIQISRIQAITQDATASTGAWAQSLREVSDASGQSILDVTAAGYAAISNQITKTKEETKAFLDVATELGRTVGSTPIESVNLLSATINAFGRNVGDARQLAAEFFKTVDIGKITVADLQNILGRAGIAGAKLGVTTTEFNAALAVLTQNGLTTEDAVTRLNNLFVKLINPTKEMTTLFRNFGTTPEQLIRINGFAGALQQIEAAIKNGNAAVEDLFPEIRTLVGFLGLSGVNAIKFSDAIDQISNSLGEYNKASDITSSKKVFGQNLKEELERLKNIAIVDIGQPFLKFIADVNTAIGGLSERLKNLIDFIRILFSSAQAAFLSLAAFKLATPIINVITASLVRLGITIAGVTTAAKFMTTAFIFHPVSLGIIAATAGYFGAIKVMEVLKERAEKAFEAIRKAGEVKFNESQLKSNIESTTNKANETFKTLSHDLGEIYAKVFQRIAVGYNKTIDIMKAKTTELVAEVKSSLDSLGHILSRTLSAMQNVERDSRKASRDNRIKQDERNEDTILRQLEGNRALLDARDQVAGVSGPGGAQLANIEQQIRAMGATEKRLKEERRKGFLETYDVSAAETAHDKLIEILDKEKRKFEEIAHAAALSLISDPNSQSGGIANLANQRALEIAALIDQANAERDQLSAQRAEAIKAEQPAVLALKDRYAALSKTITDFDFSKFEKLAPITNDTGKVIKTVAAQIDDLIEPLKKSGEEIFKDFGKIRPQIDRAGFLDEYKADIANVKNQLTKLREQARNQGLAELGANEFKKQSEIVSEAILNSKASIDAYRASIDALKLSLEATFGRVAQQVSKLPDEFPKSQPIAGITRIPSQFLTAIAGSSSGGELSKLLGISNLKDETKAVIDNLNNIKRTKDTPITLESSQNLKILTDTAAKSLDTLLEKINNLGYAQDFIKAFGLDKLKEQLDTLKNNVDSISFDVKGIDSFNAKIDALSTKSLELQGNVQRNISHILTQSTADFERFAVSTVNFQKTLLDQGSALASQARTMVAELNALSLPKAAALVNPASPIGAINPTQVDINPVQIDRLIQAVESLRIPAQLPPSPVPPSPLTRPPSGFARGGRVNNVKYYATGTLPDDVFAPKGTDTIKAMLTPGEFIMPADKTKIYIKELNAMREGRYKISGNPTTPYSFTLASNISPTLTKYDAILKSVGIPSIEEEMKKALNYSIGSGGSGGSRISFMARGGIAPSFNSQVYSMGRSTTPRYYANGGYVTSNNNNTNTFNINVTGDSGNAENMGRKIGQAIQREVRRGNVKLS